MPELTGHLLYFAYGEDLPHAGFKAACPGAEWFGPARLEDHRLVAGPGGRANVCKESGSIVWGSLWLVPAARMSELDARASDGFERTTRRIVSPAGPRTEATLYLAKGRDKGATTLARLEDLLAGAEESRLPAGYIKTLRDTFGTAPR